MVPLGGAGGVRGQLKHRHPATGEAAHAEGSASTEQGLRMYTVKHS